MSNKQIVSDLTVAIYHPENSDDQIEFKDDPQNHTVWATQKQIAETLGIDGSSVSRHIKHFKEQRGSRADRVVANFAITASDGKTYDVEHYSAVVIIYVGFRAQATDRTMAFQDWAADIVERHAGKPAVTMTPAQQFLIVAQQIVEQEQRIAEVERREHERDNQIKQIEARQDSIDHFFTVSAWANLTHKHPSKTDYQKIGRFASKYSKSHNYNITSVSDPKYGQVNCYHEDVLTIAFENWRTQNPLFDGDY